MSAVRFARELHKRVIHDEWRTVSLEEVKQEERCLDKYGPTGLVLICEECFGELHIQHLAKEAYQKQHRSSKRS